MPTLINAGFLAAGPVPIPSTSKTLFANGSAAHSSSTQPTDSVHLRPPIIAAPATVVRVEDEPLPETMMDDELGMPLNAVRTDDGALEDECVLLRVTADLHD